MSDSSTEAAAPKPLRLAALISGGGTTMVNLAERVAADDPARRLHAQISIVIASNDTAAAKGIARAHDLKLPTYVVPRKGYDSTESFSEHVFGLIRDAGADLVCLCGFLSLLQIPDDYAGKVINIHPALLPAFGGQGMHGRHVHQAVLEHGCKLTGCTVHFADQTYDTGPILVQRSCPVLEDDTPETLAARVFEQECEAYPQAINLIAAGRVTIEGRRTRIAPKPA
jgi:phosphoribosylglycinamide formyltransferase-1